MKHLTLHPMSVIVGCVLASLSYIALGAQTSVASGTTGGAVDIGPTPSIGDVTPIMPFPTGCAKSVRDQANPGTCLQASSSPVLGMLYPVTSNLFVDGASGNVGVGTTAPMEKLSVAGIIESTSGGVRFPDGTLQTTAWVAPTPLFPGSFVTTRRATFELVAASSQMLMSPVRRNNGQADAWLSWTRSGLVSVEDLDPTTGWWERLDTEGGTSLESERTAASFSYAGDPRFFARIRTGANAVDVGTQTLVAIGFSDNHTSETEGAFFTFEPLTGVWLCKTGAQVTNSGIPLTTNTIYDLELHVQVDASIVYYINGVLVASHAGSLLAGTEGRDGYIGISGPSGSPRRLYLQHAVVDVGIAFGDTGL